MSDYEIDILDWSERQAALLRRAATGERVNELDWPNIIEEIEGVGLSELRAVRSLLRQALLHDLKAEAWPLTSYVPHWRAEARIARIDAADRYVPSMRQRIEVAELYAQALRAMPETVDGGAGQGSAGEASGSASGGQPPLPVPERCPVTLDELLGEP